MTNKRQVLLARYLSGEANEKETQQVQDLMQKDTALREQLQAMQKVWQMQEQPQAQVQEAKAWQELQAQINVQERKIKIKKGFSWPDLHLPLWPFRRLASLAVILLLIGGSYLTLQHFHAKPEIVADLWQSVTVDHGRRLDLTLADGSHVVLDAGSELRYPTEFNSSRDVFLKGEAFFKVAHDAGRPFRVHAQHATVAVLGTKFNVRAWLENPTVAVTVTEGTVALSRKDAAYAQSVIIPKGYFSSLSEKGTPTTPTLVDAESSLNWMHNEIKFKDASVREVLAQLERWYDLKFDVADPQILEQRITVHIRMTRIEDILELVSILTDTQASKNDNVVTIRCKN